MQKRRYEIAIPTWPCPYCGFVHHAANLLRLDDERNLHQVSARLEARIAGVLYLLSILMGLAAMTLISRKMQAQGDQVNLIAGAL